MAYAALRERAGHGRSDAFTASEFPLDRHYDRVLAISRSGTTTEVLTALGALRHSTAASKGADAARSVPATPPVPPAPATATATTAITADIATPISQAADQVIDLGFADEQSVVQTRFATTTLALLRASLGEDLTGAIDDARTALTEPLDPAWIEADHIAYLGQGWTIGLAQEAALKAREASLSFTEAHPAMDYRHGPIALAQPGRLVWLFGQAPDGLEDQVKATGATWIRSSLDPMADLIRAQRLAIARGLARGLDPDHPRHLTRSVMLEAI
jgi:fructoselysine-6-P-deglycase FrlB-like protein